MLGILSSRSARRTKSAKDKRQRKLSIESLEHRALLAADLHSAYEHALNLASSGDELVEQAAAVVAEAVSKKAAGEGKIEVKADTADTDEIQLFVRNGYLTIKGSQYNDEIYVKKYSSTHFHVGVEWEKPSSGGIRQSEGWVTLVKISGIKRIVIAGESGNDTVLVYKNVPTPTRIFGGIGDDTIHGGNGADQIYGGMGRDKLYGRGGKDEIYGGGGSDTVNGGSGTDKVTAGSPSRKATMNSYELEVLRLVNVERKKFGLKALSADKELAYAARQHSLNMAYRSASIGNSDAHSHFLTGTRLPTVSNRIDFAGFDFSRFQENIAWSTPKKSASALVTAWMNSPGHRANILNATVTHLGVSAQQAANGAWFYTQNFGKKA